MARSVSEISSSLQQSVEAADPTIESRSGPVFNIMLQPVANEVARIEAEQERVSALYSLQFQNIATVEETEALAANFGIQRAPGAKATATVFFFRFTRPRQPAVVRRGSLVSNLDSTLQYIVQEDAVIDPDNADAFFNAARRAYEIPVNVEAISPGERFNVPAFRIQTLVTPNTDFDGIENRAPASGGSERETQAQEVARIRSNFAGLNLGSVDGIGFTAVNSFPELIKDVSIIQPSSVLFKRTPTTPALDIYIAGSNIENVRQNFVALGGETTLNIAQSPVVPSSLSLSINGESEPNAILFKDTGILSGSVRANDIVILPAPLNTGDVVTFTYDINRLILDIQNEYEPSSVGDSLLFGTDILVFEAKNTSITVKLEIRVASSFDVPRTTDQVQGVVFSFVERNEFAATLFPEQLRTNILNTVQGVSSLSIVEFRRTDTSLRDVEIIELDRNEISFVDAEAFQLNVR